MGVTHQILPLAIFAMYNECVRPQADIFLREAHSGLPQLCRGRALRARKRVALCVMLSLSKHLCRKAARQSKALRHYSPVPTKSRACTVGAT